MKKIDDLLDELMEELTDNYDYTEEEKLSIRSKLTDAYREGYYDALEDKGFIAYGKKEDFY